MKRAHKNFYGLLTVLVIGLGALYGCAQQISTQEPVSNAPVTVGDEAIEATAPADKSWPFRPTKLRIHPLTRTIMDKETNEPIIEVRIEFFDPRGHTTKGVGQVRIDLLREKGSADADVPIAVWSRDLRDLEANFAHYDEVTQTYLFRLRIDGKPMPPNPRINAYFLAADGIRLEAKYQLQHN